MRILGKILFLLLLVVCTSAESTAPKTSIVMLYDNQTIILAKESHRIFIENVTDVCGQDSILLLLNDLCDSNSVLIIRTEKTAKDFKESVTSCFSKLSYNRLQFENISNSGVVRTMLDELKKNEQKQSFMNLIKDDMKRVVEKDAN